MQAGNRDRPQPDRRFLFGGIRLGRLGGVEVALDWSLLIIFSILALSLAMGVLPRWHPGWTSGLAWAVALGAAVLFFVSVLLHELAHALVAKAFGLPVRRITLFIFGGVAHLSEEPPSPIAEFVIALVGPLTSIAIGILALVLGSMAVIHPLDITARAPGLGLQRVGPLPTLLLWLGPVNLILGLFNLVPAFPLDGGRLLRAVLWGSTGNLLRATRWASGVGRAFGWGLMAIGAAMAVGLRVPALGTGFANGLWLVLIGWFLSQAAQTSYQQMLQRDALRGIPVSQLMYSRLDMVPASMVVQKLVEEGILHSDQRAFPVVESDRLVGLVSLEDVRRLARERWGVTTVGEIMTPAERLATVTPDEDAVQAMKQLSEWDVNQLPVVENGRVLGVVRRQDIVKWLGLQRRWAQ